MRLLSMFSASDRNHPSAIRVETPCKVAGPTRAVSAATWWLSPGRKGCRYRVALNRDTGAIVYEHKLPTSANAPIAVAGNAILVPAGGPNLYGPKGGTPQLVACTVR